MKFLAAVFNWIRAGEPKHTELEYDPTYEVGTLPISALAGPEFTQANLTRLLDLRSQFTVANAQQLVERNGAPSDLTRAFNTQTRYQQICSALNRFDDSLKRWVAGERHDPRLTWLLPAELANEDSLDSTQIEIIRSVLPRINPSIAEPIEHQEDLEKWIPFLSLELIDRLGSFHNSDYSILRRLLLRVSHDACGISSDGPWEAEFPSQLIPLSIFRLFEYEPTRRCMTLLRRLDDVHCSNIGHLSAIHPSSWRSIKSIPLNEWRAMHVGLINGRQV